MIGVLVCRGCGAHWVCPNGSPLCPYDVRCGDCGRTLRPEDLALDPDRFPFPLGTCRYIRKMQLKVLLRKPRPSHWLKQLARSELARLRGVA